MKQLFLPIVLIILLLTNLSVIAQVTMGSETTPVTGALLDLKEHTPDASNITATKGLGLPRVSLRKLKPTTPEELSASIGNTGTWDLKEHIGLTVYNSDPACYATNVYVWTGVKWVPLVNQQIEEGSYESDVEALKLLYKSNPGNNLDWDIENGDPTSFTGTRWRRDDVCGNHRLIWLNVGLMNLTSDAGINQMDQLTGLFVTSNQLTSLRVTNCKELIELYCAGNQITELDVSQNTKLQDLRCSSNQISRLDVTNNKEMTYLNCGTNQLTTLNIGEKPVLTYLSCSNNQLTSINISQSPQLATLHCFTNNLTALDVTVNTELKTFQCGSNQLTSLNVTNNIKLDLLSCGYNPLTTLNVTQNTLLKTLRCSSNQLTTLDISQNLLLTELDCVLNWLSQSEVNNFKVSNPNYCNITLVRATPQYYPNTTTSHSLTLPTCP